MFDDCHEKIPPIWLWDGSFGKGLNSNDMAELLDFLSANLIVRMLDSVGRCTQGGMPVYLLKRE